MSRSFRALFACQPDVAPAHFEVVDEQALDPGEVLIEVLYSSLNYKDGLAITGKAPVVRRFPLICGIDLVGRVLECDDGIFAHGALVAVAGCGLGEDHHGGYAELARVPSSWCVPLPTGLSPRHAMTLGTAGVTAGLSLLALEHGGVRPIDSRERPVLVTGAMGGVGSLAVALLAGSGYDVVASTGRPAEREFLEHLGARSVIDRAELTTKPRALDKERFCGAVDVVGGVTLANVIAQTSHGGVVAACGLVESANLETTVYPFILRSVTLAGINSAYIEPVPRSILWERMAHCLKTSLLEELTEDHDLDDVIGLGEKIIAGQVRGRVVIKTSS